MEKTTLKIAKIATAIVGLGIVFWGLVISLVVVLGLIFAPEEAGVDSIIIGAAFLTLGLGLGGALTWQAGRAFWVYPSARFWLPPVWILLLIFIPTLVIGQLLLSFDIWPRLTFPLFHLIAAIMPSLTLLAFVGRSLKAVVFRWREVILQLAGGAFVSTTLAFMLEIISGVATLIVVLTITALFPGGLSLLEELATNLQDPIWFEDPNNLSELLLSPPVAATVILVFVILAPFIEELVKLTGVVSMSYRRPALARAFLWGVAGGAGFGLVENLLNTVTGLEVWALVMVMRVGATLMHGLTSGLMAMGWRSFLVERRWQRFIGVYGLSVAIHAAWNGAVIGMASSALVAADSSIAVVETWGSWAALLFAGLLLFLATAMVVTFVMITYRLRDGVANGEAERMINLSLPARSPNQQAD